MKNKNIIRCKNCLNLSTRPRIKFDSKGICNACLWTEEKKTIDWEKRTDELKDLVSNAKKNTKSYDCLIPVSGGKDGSYVTHQLKTIYGLNPLCVTFRPPLEMDLGKNNLNNFIKSDIAHIHITPNAKSMKAFNKFGFIEKGFPYYGFLVGINCACLRIASNFGINLVFYGEDGEVEYGGSTETKYSSTYDTEYKKKVYLEGGHDNIIKDMNLSDSESYFFQFPSSKELENIKITHWSYFESWDPYRNYLIAKEHFGLKENENSNSGTFTNFAQNDQYLYALHTYMMYLKFGFGRATQDAGIEIRRGAMTREQGINLINLYDSYYPKEFLETYLDYFEMNIDEFNLILDKWANKEIFEKINGVWTQNFENK